jgi:hypothetical protein
MIVPEWRAGREAWLVKALMDREYPGDRLHSAELRAMVGENLA